MTCQRARELTSAFYDQELEPDTRAAVHEHLETCPECTERLAQFKELSNLAADMRQPEVPAGTWPAISASLEAQRRGIDDPQTHWRWHAPVALAAVLLVGATLALFSYLRPQPSDDHHEHEMAEAFNLYLERLQGQPDDAEEVLVARYNGRRVEPAEAAVLANFEPNAPDELPGGFSRSGIYVLKMPCCTCTQSIYENRRGQMLALFEHDDQQRSWFGDRPTINAQCHDKATCLVQLKDSLAACWKCGPRHLTVVGIRDVEQVFELVAYLDRQRQTL